MSQSLGWYQGSVNTAVHQDTSSSSRGSRGRGLLLRIPVSFKVGCGDWLPGRQAISLGHFQTQGGPGAQVALDPGSSPVLRVTQDGDRAPGCSSRHRLGMCIPGGAQGSLPCGGGDVSLVCLLCASEEVGYIACWVDIRDLRRKDFRRQCGDPGKLRCPESLCQ